MLNLTAVTDDFQKGGLLLQGHLFNSQCICASCDTCPVEQEVTLIDVKGMRKSTFFIESIYFLVYSSDTAHNSWYSCTRNHNYIVVFSQCGSATLRTLYRPHIVPMVTTNLDCNDLK